ncbi:MAG: polysaccharide biosynthesis protein [Ruminiclostridium sp.]
MKYKIRALSLAALDLILINASLILAYYLRLDDIFRNPEYTHFVNEIPQLIIIASVVKLITYMAFKLYSSLWKYAGAYELSKIIMASLVSNTFMLGYVFLTRTPIPRSIFIITFFIDCFSIGAIRFGYRIFRRLVRGDILLIKSTRKVMLIGAGDAGAALINEYHMHPELKCTPVAIIDDNRGKQNRKLNGVSVLGAREDIVKVAEDKQVDEIIITIPSASPKTINELFTICSNTKCKVKILPSLSQLIDETVSVQKIRDVNIEDLLGRDTIKLDNNEIGGLINEQVVMVTGGGGSIGAELCRQIAMFSPKRLIILDNYENNAYDIQNELLAKYPNLKLNTIIANVREKSRLDNIFNQYRPDIIFHAAAHKHVPLMEENPTEAIKNNVFGTLNVAECADKYGAKRFVMISTDKAVNPTNIMGATKRVAEMIIQAFSKQSKTEFVAVRFGNVLGSNGSVIPLFKRQIEQGGPVTVTHPEIIRFFMTIPEAVQLVLQAGAMAEGGEIFVLDMGEPVKICDLARNLIKLSGFEPDVDIKLEFTGLRPGEKLYEELLLAEEGIQATKNDKIYVAQPLHTDLAILKREIECLKEIISTNADGARDYIKVIVPNYKQSS